MTAKVSTVRRKELSYEINAVSGSELHSLSTRRFSVADSV